MYITINENSHLSDFKFYTIWQFLWVANEVLGFYNVPEIEINDGKVIVIESFPLSMIRLKRKDVTFSFLKTRIMCTPLLKKWGYTPVSKTGIFSIEEIAMVDPWQIKYSVTFWSRHCD